MFILQIIEVDWFIYTFLLQYWVFKFGEKISIEELCKTQFYYNTEIHTSRYYKCVYMLL